MDDDFTHAVVQIWCAHLDIDDEQEGWVRPGKQGGHSLPHAAMRANVIHTEEMMSVEQNANKRRRKNVRYGGDELTNI